MMKTKALLSRLPAVALVAAVTTYPLASQAAVLTAGAAVETGVADTDFNGILADLVTNEISTPSDPSIDTGYMHEGDGMNYGSARAAANQDGWMYSTAYGENTFKSISHVQQSLTITNDTGVDQNYSFDFTILNGSLGAWGSYDQFADDEFIAAGNLVSISLDGVELFGSAALLVADNTGVDLQTDGAVLGSYTANADYYGWDALSDTLDLGVLAAGESFTLTYDIVTAAAGIFAPSDSENCGGDDIDYGEGCYDWASAYSQFGDPNGVHGSPIAGNVHGSPVMSVPEPSLWLLMGTGLFGFAVARQRKAAKA